jgi:hypothetical protein
MLPVDRGTVEGRNLGHLVLPLDSESLVLDAAVRTQGSEDG